MLCFRCGSQVGAGAALCQSCGQRFSPAQRLATPTPPRAQRSLGAPLPFKLGDVVAQRYEARRLIGEGPLGVVYVAHDRETEVDLALKVIRPSILPRPSDREAFFEAMRRLRGVGHFNLNHVIEVDRDGERCFFTVPLLEGLSLRKLMALRRSRNDRFTLGEVVPIAAQVADALAAGIRTGAHGDLKPDNVIILPEMLKVTDFGLGLALPRAEFLQAQEASAEAAAYLAPEVRDGGAPDSCSDIFAFGTMLVELLSGQLPSGARIRLRDYQPDLPARLEDLTQRMLNEDPSGRPDSPEDAVQELAAAESGTERGAPPSVRRSFAPEQTQRISADMLEEVLDTADGMDEDAFAGELEAQAAAIDMQTAAALADAAEGVLTDPGLLPVRMDPAIFASDAALGPDVTQKISSEMVVEMLEGEGLDDPPPLPAARGSAATVPDDLDPRLVRAALGVELDESAPQRSFEELSDAKTRALPPLRPEDSDDGTDSTDEMPRLRPQPVARPAEASSGGERGRDSTDKMPRLRPEAIARPTGGSSGVEPVEAPTTLERPLPDRTMPAQRALAPTSEDDATRRAPRPTSRPGAPAVRGQPGPAKVAPVSPQGAARPPAATPVAPVTSGRPPRPAPAATPAIASPAQTPVAAAQTPQPPRPRAPTPPPPPPPPTPVAAARTAPAPPAPSSQPPPARSPAGPQPVRVAAKAPASSSPPGSPVAPAELKSSPAVQALPAIAAQPVQSPTSVPGGFSDQWYAAEADLQEGGAEDSGKRREPTRVIRTDPGVRRDLSGIWVWVALAVGLLAFLVGGGFYWQRLQRDARDRAARELVRQLQEAERSAQMPESPAPPGPAPLQAPPRPLAPDAPAQPRPPIPAPAPGLPLAPSPPPPP